MRVNTGVWIISLVFLVIGLYLINIPFNFIKIPDAIASLDSWIIGVGGLLNLWGLILYFKRYG
jgi:hypothetical protein